MQEYIISKIHTPSILDFQGTFLNYTSTEVNLHRLYNSHKRNIVVIDTNCGKF